MEEVNNITKNSKLSGSKFSSSAQDGCTSSAQQEGCSSSELLTECSICLDRKPDLILPCAHSYCCPCIEQW